MSNGTSQPRARVSQALFTLLIMRRERGWKHRRTLSCYFLIEMGFSRKNLNMGGWITFFFEIYFPVIVTFDSPRTAGLTPRTLRITLKQSYFNRINFCAIKFRDFANFCHFREIKTREHA